MILILIYLHYGFTSFVFIILYEKSTKFYFSRLVVNFEGLDFFK
jgi:hypothetical protein